VDSPVDLTSVKMVGLRREKGFIRDGREYGKRGICFGMVAVATEAQSSSPAQRA
jgi:hypothetical protein